MIQLTNLAFGYGDENLYENVNFIIGDNQKIGLVGSNGSGKSTLLAIIAGKLNQTEGQVNVDGKIGIVPQEVKNDPEMEASLTVKAYVDPDNIHEDHKIKKLFNGLEFKLDLDAAPQKLSGGQKTRLALARALLAEPDILMLDEPTNFMDTAGKKWVMNFLSRYPNTVIVISHDLELMNHAIDKILSVNSFKKSIDEYKGNYQDFVRIKAQHDENLRKEMEIKSRHLKKAEDRYNNMRANSKKSILRKRIEREREALPDVP
ncbi:hypothetical protein BH10PAT1_BH10PAT1_5980 [soil metagenome]